MGIRSIRLVLGLSLACLIQATMQAEVVRVEISARRDLAAGKGYGLAGPFEKLEGRLFFAVDPANSANRVSADIDKAPRNVAGQVEFSADFFLIKPKRAERGNGTLLFEVSNRGGKGMISFFNRGARGGANPESEADLGDGFLPRQGFTLLWVGWQFDPPRREGLMRDYPPIASDGGRPIRGLVRSDFVVATRSFDQSLADREHIYPTDIFPFTDTPQADPETGISDGLLTHAGKPELLPKIFYTNSSYEYWGRAASLIHTTLDGQKDMPLPDDVRIYLFSGGQHGPAAFPPRQSIGRQRNNPNDYRWFMRSLLLAMNRWVSENASPPLCGQESCQQHYY